MPHDSHWQHWHEQYAEPENPLNRRLSIIRGHVAHWYEERRAAGCGGRVLSLCSGDGRDVIEVLAERVGDRHLADVRVVLVELDEILAKAARERAADVGLTNVEVRTADAGLASSHQGAVPADLVLLCGIFGNVSDDDVRRTVVAVPQLAAPGATIVWTRSRRAPDLTPQIRAWFEETGCKEVAFNAPAGELFSVGVCRFEGAPAAFDPTATLFRFTSTPPC